jgi:hypothetical protein
MDCDRLICFVDDPFGYELCVTLQQAKDRFITPTEFFVIILCRNSLWT